MCKQLVSKARWTCMYAETIAQLDAAGRLLHLLLLYNDEFGQVEEEGRRSVLDLGLNQTDLASLVGARRGWINSILQDWRKRGLIELEAGKITFLDLPRIRHERDSRIAAHFA
jgi:CRP-like cAMP-binding protein